MIDFLDVCDLFIARHQLWSEYQAADGFTKRYFPPEAALAYLAGHLSAATGPGSREAALGTFRKRLEQAARAATPDRKAAAQQAEERRVEQAAAAWERAEYLLRCDRCSFVYPHFLVRQCPSCNAAHAQVVVHYPSLTDHKTFVKKFATDDHALVLELLPTLQLNITQAIRDRQAVWNFEGVADLALEVLMRHPTPPEGCADVRLVLDALHGAVESLFDIPPLDYHRPLSHCHLPPELQGSWEFDLFPQAVILAYALGARRERLPQPHDALLRFYRALAQKQHGAIQAAADACRTRKAEFAKRAPPPPPPDIKAEIAGLLGLGLTPAGVEAQLAPASPTPTPDPTPLSQEDY